MIILHTNVLVPIRRDQLILAPLALPPRSTRYLCAAAAAEPPPHPENHDQCSSSQICFPTYLPKTGSLPTPQHSGPWLRKYAGCWVLAGKAELGDVLVYVHLLEPLLARSTTFVFQS